MKELDGDLKIVALHRGGRIGDCNVQGYNCGTLIWEITNDLTGVNHSPCELLSMILTWPRFSSA